MSDICENCRHAQPVDPKGSWRKKDGCEDWPKTHIHCGLYDYPKTHVINKRMCCTWLPSRYEAKEPAYPDINGWCL